MLIHVFFRQVAADTHIATATERSSARLLRQRNRRHRDFRAPHKQINKAWWETSPPADVGRQTSVDCTYYKYYISRRTPLLCRGSPCWLRRLIALNQTDHSAVSNKPVCIKYEYRKLIYCAFKINQRSAEIRINHRWTFTNNTFFLRCGFIQLKYVNKFEKQTSSMT